MASTACSSCGAAVTTSLAACTVCGLAIATASSQERLAIPERISRRSGTLLIGGTIAIVTIVLVVAFYVSR